uniref:endonuclease/exonuclease/phosphatase family protein n=1 Tax=Thiolapillus sp. TaxID=2017437 RepID=UPI003AF84051
MTNIIQWNVRGLRANFEELRLLCNQYNPQIVAVQECQLRKDKIINLTGFSGLTKSSPGDNATGGVTLYVNKSVLFSEIKLDTDLQAVAVRVSAKKTLTVCNVYLPPSLDINFSDLEHLIQQLPAPFVLVGDLNAHSPLWGDARQDSRGQIVEKLLNDYSLCLLNTGEPTYRHHSHNSFSVPGVSI